jgi:hypothetical protein
VILTRFVQRYDLKQGKEGREMKEIKRAWMMVGLFVLCLFVFGWADKGGEKKEGPSIKELVEKEVERLVKPARRPLSPEEAQWMAELIAKALSPKERGKPSLPREEAIFALGDKIGHVAVIPILEQIARDREEYKFIRRTAVMSLARVADEEAIEALIRILDEAEKALKQNPKDAGAREVEGAASEMLFRLLGMPIQEIDSKKSKAENLRAYWEKVRKKIDLRKSVYVLKVITY